MTADPPPERPPVSTERLVATAMELTRETSLNAWTMRDLERRARASPSSIYHHVGSREALCERVVDAIVAPVTVPHEAEHWQDFFRASCDRIYDALTPYPGSAAWLMMHGPVLARSADALEVGIGRLQDAGIEPAGLAYSQIVNHALGIIVAADDRRRTAAAQHAHVVRRLDEVESTGDGAGVRAMQAFLGAFATPDPQERAAARRAYFNAGIDVMLAGIEVGYPTGTIRDVTRFA